MATNRSSVRRAGRNRISRLLVTTSTLLGISTLAGLTTGAVDAPPPAGATTSASTLYVGNPTNHTITSYGIPTTGGNVKPGVTVSLAGNPSPAQLAFDASGDLWTANTDAGTISEYMPTQLAAGGTQSAAVTITCTEPVGLVFTGAGDLWVANWFGSTLSEYTPTQLKASSHPTAAVKISSNGKTPREPHRPCEPGGGRLWRPLGGQQQQQHDRRVQGHTVDVERRSQSGGHDYVQWDSPRVPAWAGLRYRWGPLGGQQYSQHDRRVQGHTVDVER